MKWAAAILWITVFASTTFGEIGVEYQGVEAFVQTSGDVRIVYDFLIAGDGAQTYDTLPVSLPYNKYDRSRMNAYVRRESVTRIEPAGEFREAEWTRVPAAPSGEKDSENDLWLDLKGWTPTTGRPIRVRLDVWVLQLVALDTVCEKTAGVLTGFTSFTDPDRSAKAHLRVHLPPRAALEEVIAYRSVGNAKYQPMLPRNGGDHVVIEWETRGQPGYEWVYTMFPAESITAKLNPDWRYSKDSEPRSFPLETLEMNVRVEESNDTRMDISYRAENTHSCLPLRTITFHLPNRGNVSAVTDGHTLKSKKTGRRRPTYTFFFPEPGISPGRNVDVKISGRFRMMIYRIPEESDFVKLNLSPNLYGSPITQPSSRRIVRIELLPDTDLRKVTAGEVPFSGTGTMQGRPYVYWDLTTIRELSVKFPRGRIKRFHGYYDFSRPSEWLAMLKQVREVQYFLIACAIVIYVAHRRSRRVR